MVHGLETLRRLNAEKTGQKAQAQKENGVPAEIALCPAAARAYVNRRLTEKERGGKPDAFDTYALDANAPFKGNTGGSEGPRT